MILPNVNFRYNTSSTITFSEKALTMTTKLAGFFGCLVLLLAAAAPAFGQRPLRRYQPPAGPTITPYLNYNRPDFSTLPSDYQSFIVPQQRLQRNLYDLARSQQADFRKIETQIKQVRESSAAATGIRGGFMNYSHFYPGAASGSNQR